MAEVPRMSAIGGSLPIRVEIVRGNLVGLILASVISGASELTVGFIDGVEQSSKTGGIFNRPKPIEGRPQHI